jgi:hypothetical protein
MCHILCQAESAPQVLRSSASHCAAMSCRPAAEMASMAALVCVERMTTCKQLHWRTNYNNTTSQNPESDESVSGAWRYRNSLPWKSRLVIWTGSPGCLIERGSSIGVNHPQINGRAPTVVSSPRATSIGTGPAGTDPVPCVRGVGSKSGQSYHSRHLSPSQYPRPSCSRQAKCSLGPQRQVSGWTIT